MTISFTFSNWSSVSPPPNGLLSSNPPPYPPPKPLLNPPPNLLLFIFGPERKLPPIGLLLFIVVFVPDGFLYPCALLLL